MMKLTKIVALACVFCINSLLSQESNFDHFQILSIKNLNPDRPNSTEVYLKDLIQFDVKKNDSLQLLEPNELFLYINGYRMSPYQAKYVTENSVVFQLYDSDTLRGLLNHEINSWGIHETKVRMSFGNKVGEHVHLNQANMTIDFDPSFNIRSWIGRGIIMAIIIVFFTLVHKSPFLKSASGSKYSLSRVQLAWWTMIVLCCYIALWSDSGVLIPLTGDTLILLGISAGTAATAQTIDISNLRNQNLNAASTQTPPQVAVHKDQNILFQILSDANGINIQRFQSVIFTFFIGVFFVFEVITKFEMPNLDSGILGLMGISSATYAGLKTNEGKS